MKMAHHFYIDTVQVKFSLCMSNNYSRHLPLTKSTPAPFHPFFFTPTLPDINYQQYASNPTYRQKKNQQKNPPICWTCKVQAKWPSKAFFVWTTFQASVRY